MRIRLQLSYPSTWAWQYAKTSDSSKRYDCFRDPDAKHSGSVSAWQSKLGISAKKRGIYRWAARLDRTMTAWRTARKTRVSLASFMMTEAQLRRSIRKSLHANGTFNPGYSPKRGEQLRKRSGAQSRPLH